MFVFALELSPCYDPAFRVIVMVDLDCRLIGSFRWSRNRIKIMIRTVLGCATRTARGLMSTSSGDALSTGDGSVPGRARYDFDLNVASPSKVSDAYVPV